MERQPQQDDDHWMEYPTISRKQARQAQQKRDKVIRDIRIFIAIVKDDKIMHDIEILKCEFARQQNTYPYIVRYCNFPQEIKMQAFSIMYSSFLLTNPYILYSTCLWFKGREDPLAAGITSHRIKFWQLMQYWNMRCEFGKCHPHQTCMMHLPRQHTYLYSNHFPAFQLPAVLVPMLHTLSFDQLILWSDCECCFLTDSTTNSLSVAINGIPHELASRMFCSSVILL